MVMSTIQIIPVWTLLITNKVKSQCQELIPGVYNYVKNKPKNSIVNWMQMKIRLFYKVQTKLSFDLST